MNLLISKKSFFSCEEKEISSVDDDCDPLRDSGFLRMHSITFCLRRVNNKNIFNCIFNLQQQNKHSLCNYAKICECHAYLRFDFQSQPSTHGQRSMSSHTD